MGSTSELKHLILIVDDNKDNRDIAKLFLRSDLYEFLECANGEDAVSAVLNHKIDLILMDIRMPIMNGYEATQKIREYNLNVPIVFCTANDSKEALDKAMSSGGDEFITKPIVRDELINLMSKILGDIQN